jgi:hypothetical protein
MKEAAITGGGSGQTLSGDAEGFGLGAGVAIAADFAVGSSSGDRRRSSGSPFLGTRCIRRPAAIPSHCSPRRAQAVFHSCGCNLKRPLQVCNPPRAISQAGNAHRASIVPARDKLPKGLSRPGPREGWKVPRAAQEVVETRGGLYENQTGTGVQNDHRKSVQNDDKNKIGIIA